MFLKEHTPSASFSRINNFTLYFVKEIVYTVTKINRWKDEKPVAHDSKLKDEKIDMLFEAILTLESVEECYNFFEDLCTISELKEMSKRLYAAKLLNSNRIYNEIAAQTGLSTATISRVNRSINEGFQLAFERLK